MRNALLLLLTHFLTAFVSANTEKVIFLGPEHTQISDAHANLQDLSLDTLSPAEAKSSKLQTYLEVIFPSVSSPQGVDYWYLLEDLIPGCRYEVRVCWAAIQPTQFWLHTYTLSEVFDSPELINSLASYTESKALRQQTTDEAPEIEVEKPDKTSTLFLKVSAAADFYSSNQTLMSGPPPVLVDVILDRYVLNILPSSLVPTAIYIIILAVLSWYLSGYVSAWLSEITKPDKAHTE